MSDDIQKSNGLRFTCFLKPLIYFMIEWPMYLNMDELYA